MWATDACVFTPVETDGWWHAVVVDGSSGWREVSRGSKKLPARALGMAAAVGIVYEDKARLGSHGRRAGNSLVRAWRKQDDDGYVSFEGEAAQPRARRG